jgi:hypothetical protein
MATNGKSGDNRRHGAVKRDTETGQFMDVKTSDKSPFKGVRKEK